MIETEAQKKRLTRKIDIDEISERIAIIRSNDCKGQDMVRLVEEVKKDLEFGRVERNEEKYWGEIKSAAEGMI